MNTRPHPLLLAIPVILSLFSAARTSRAATVTWAGGQVRAGKKVGGGAGPGNTPQNQGQRGKVELKGQEISYLPGDQTFGRDVLVTSDPGMTSLNLSNLHALAIGAESTVVINLCAGCTVDMRGNPPGTPIIVAPHGICIHGIVLTDPGVLVSQLTQPPANVSPGPCQVPAAVGDESRARTSLGSTLPNPFRESTTIAYTLATPSRVTLRIYDPAGRTVRTLVDREDTAGPHAAVWDGRNDAGDSVASGLYLSRFEVVGGASSMFRAAGKIELLR